jgi:hypothetical protein
MAAHAVGDREDPERRIYEITVFVAFTLTPRITLPPRH